MKKASLKIISVLLIPTFLLSGVSYADYPAVRKDTLAPHYATQVIEEYENELKSLSSTVRPARGKPREDEFESLVESIRQRYSDNAAERDARIGDLKRAYEVKRGWLKKTAALLAAKMTARVREKALERKVSAADAAEALVSHAGEWARKNSVPESRTRALIAAIREEFGRQEFPDPAATPPERRVVMLISGGESAGVNDDFALLAMKLARLGYSLEAVKGGLDNIIGERKRFDDNRVWVNRARAEGILHMGGAAWGTARTAIKDDKKGIDNTKAVLDNIKGYAKTLVIIGGNDHTKQAEEFAAECARQKEDIAVIAFPKTVDRDTKVYPIGAHTAGDVLRQIVRRAAARPQGHECVVVESMGQRNGYLTAAALDPDDPTIFAAIPEYSADKSVTLQDVANGVWARMMQYGAATLVLSEGFSVSKDDPLLKRVLASDKVLKARYEKVKDKKDAHGNPRLGELGIADFVAKAIELELAARYRQETRRRLHVDVEVPGFSFRSTAPDDVDKAVAEKTTDAAADWIVSRRPEILEMGGICVAAQADLKSAADVRVKTMALKDAVGTIDLDSPGGIFTREALAKMPILGLGAITESDKLPGLPDAIMNMPKPPAGIDAAFALKLIASQVESARALNRPNICVIGSDEAGRLIEELKKIVKDEAGCRASLPDDVRYAMARNSENILALGYKEGVSLSEIASNMAEAMKRKEGARLFIPVHYLINASDAVLAELLGNEETREAVTEIVSSAARITDQERQYYAFGKRLMDLLYITLTAKYGMSGVRKNVLGKALNKLPETDPAHGSQAGTAAHAVTAGAHRPHPAELIRKTAGYGSAIADRIKELKKAGKKRELEEFIRMASARVDNIERIRNAFRAGRAYNGYDVVVITNSQEEETKIRQDELDWAFKGITTRAGRPVIALSVTDASYGGQIIGQINTDHIVRKILNEKGYTDADIAGMSIATIHNGGKGDRYSPAAQADDLSRGKQLLASDIENSAGEKRDMTLMLGVMASVLEMAATLPKPVGEYGRRRDVFWGSQIVAGTIAPANVRRSNYAIDKFAIPVNWKDPEILRKLHDFGTMLYDEKTGQIITFFANKQLTTPTAKGYVPNEKAEMKYRRLRSAEVSKDITAAYDFGSFSMSGEMRQALDDFWTKYRLFRVMRAGREAHETIFDIMEKRRDGRAIISKRIKPGAKEDEAVSRDIDPAFIQILVPFIDALKKVALSEGLTSAKHLRRIRSRADLYDKLKKLTRLLFHHLPEDGKLAIASAVDPRLSEDKLRESIRGADDYLSRNPQVEEVIAFWLLFRDRTDMFGDMNKVVGSINLGRDSLWLTYRRLLDLGNEKLAMLPGITEKLVQIDPDGSVKESTPDSNILIAAQEMRMVRGITDEKIAVFNFMGKPYALTKDEVNHGVFIDVKGRKVYGKEGLASYDSNPDFGIWIKSSMVAGEDSLLMPGSSIVNSVINKSQGMIRCEDYYVTQSTVMGLTGEGGKPIRGGVAYKVSDDSKKGVVVPSDRPIATDIYRPEIDVTKRFPHLGKGHTRFFVKPNHDPKGHAIVLSGGGEKKVESDAQTLDVSGKYNLAQVREEMSCDSKEDAKIEAAYRKKTLRKISEADRIISASREETMALVARQEELFARGYNDVPFGTSGVRGTVEQLTDLTAYAKTMGFIKLLEKTGEIKRGGTISIAGDRRSSTPRMLAAVAQAIADSGYKVDYCGIVPTQVVAFWGWQNNRASIMVTGSHLPDDRNGIKFNMRGREVLKADEKFINQYVPQAIAELKRTRDLSELFEDDGNFRRKALDSISAKYLSPRKINHEARTAFIERIKKAFPEGLLKGVKVLLYEHSAAGRELYHEIMEGYLGAEVIAPESVTVKKMLQEKGVTLEKLREWHAQNMFETVGKKRITPNTRIRLKAKGFVSVDTEDITDFTQALLNVLAKEHSPDIIQSMDGDSDRPLVADETGDVVFGDVLGYIVAKYMDPHLASFTENSNKGVEEALKDAHVMAVRTEQGSPYVLRAAYDYLGKFIGKAAEETERETAAYLAREGCERDRAMAWESNGGVLLVTGWDMKTTDGRFAGKTLKGLPTRDSFIGNIVTAIRAKEAKEKGQAFSEYMEDVYRKDLSSSYSKGSVVRDTTPRCSAYTPDTGKAFVAAFSPEINKREKKDVIVQVDFNDDGTLEKVLYKGKNYILPGREETDITDERLLADMKAIRDGLKHFFPEKDPRFGRIIRLRFINGVKVFFAKKVQSKGERYVYFRPSGNEPILRWFAQDQSKAGRDAILKARFEIVPKMIKELAGKGKPSASTATAKGTGHRSQAGPEEASPLDDAALQTFVKNFDVEGLVDLVTSRLTTAEKVKQAFRSWGEGYGPKLEAFEAALARLNSASSAPEKADGEAYAAQERLNAIAYANAVLALFDFGKMDERAVRDMAASARDDLTKAMALASLFRHKAIELIPLAELYKSTKDDAARAVLFIPIFAKTKRVSAEMLQRLKDSKDIFTRTMAYVAAWRFNAATEEEVREMADGTGDDLAKAMVYTAFGDVDRLLALYRESITTNIAAKSFAIANLCYFGVLDAGKAVSELRVIIATAGPAQPLPDHGSQAGDAEKAERGLRAGATPKDFADALMRWAHMPADERNRSAFQPVWDFTVALNMPNEAGRIVTLNADVYVCLEKLNSGGAYNEELKIIYKTALLNRAGIKGFDNGNGNLGDSEKRALLRAAENMFYFAQAYFYMAKRDFRASEVLYQSIAEIVSSFADFDAGGYLKSLRNYAQEFLSRSPGYTGPPADHGSAAGAAMTEDAIKAVQEAALARVTELTRKMNAVVELSMGAPRAETSDICVVMKDLTAKTVDPRTDEITRKEFLARKYTPLVKRLREIIPAERIKTVKSENDITTLSKELMDKEKKRVIVLDIDGSFAKGRDKEALAKMLGEGAGKRYCVVGLDGEEMESLPALEVALIPLPAMANLGIAILNDDRPRFEAAYRAMLGKAVPEDEIARLCENGIPWLISRLPVTVPFNGDSQPEQKRLRAIIQAAA